LGKAESEPVYCFCGIRRIGSAILTQAFTWNVRTSRCNVKRKLQARDTARRKVSMYSTGAETSVVVSIAVERQQERREVVFQFLFIYEN
jgi:hypothetical protein